MTYPAGTPSSGVYNVFTGNAFTPLSTVTAIRDNITSIDKASLTNSLGVQVSYLQNFVNETYLARSGNPVNQAYLTNIQLSGVVSKNLINSTGIYIYNPTNTKTNTMTFSGLYINDQSNFRSAWITGMSGCYIFGINASSRLTKDYLTITNPYGTLTVYPTGILITDGDSSGWFKNNDIYLSDNTYSGILKTNELFIAEVGGFYNSKLTSRQLLINNNASDRYATFGYIGLTLSGYGEELSLNTNTMEFKNVNATGIYSYNMMRLSKGVNTTTIYESGIISPGLYITTPSILFTSLFGTNPEIGGVVWNSGGYLCVSAG